MDMLKKGDYSFPKLIYSDDTRPVGRWGRMYGAHLEKEHPGRYAGLLLGGTLQQTLADVNDAAEHWIIVITGRLKETEGVTEKLKAEDQMEWVRRMNSIRCRAEEIVRTELIYA